MDTIDSRIQPSWLPQMEADMDYVKEELTKNGVQYEMVQLNPKELKPLQATVRKEKVDEFYNMIDGNEPINSCFISAQNEILDGHHRAYAFMQHPEISKIDAFKVLLPTQDAIRMLNKIQDRYNWEQELEQGEPQFLSFTPNIEDMGDVTPPSSDDLYFEDVQKNPQTLKLYKNNSIINTKSKTGDFLLLTLKPSFENEFEIEFDNLLEVTDTELAGYQIPAEYLANTWFPDLDLKKEALKSALAYEVFLNRKVNEKAKQIGVDGIKYGDKFVQVIN